MPKAVQNQPLDCLVALLSFETYWAYYLQSDGQLYGREARSSARSWIEPATALMSTDKGLGARLSREMVPDQTAENVLSTIRDWAKGDSVFPFESAGRSRFMMFVITAPLKEHLMSLLEVTAGAGTDYTFAEMDFQRRQLLWSAYLSRRLIGLLPDDVPGFLSSSDTIAVLGDIRRSQDLMTYGPDPETFSRNMLAFVDTTRRLLAENNGVFDKFTGDGFLAYFNTGLCAKAGRDHRECMMDFVRAIALFSSDHFRKWGFLLRKHPGQEIGLAIGADFGRIGFRHEGNVLFAVGPAIVWADRMCREAEAGELVVNNLLAGHLTDKYSLPFERVAGHTKTNESFMGFRLHL
jgi:class 3 adenylate cyclase